MRVELSPWEIVRTSLSLPSTKRKRRKAGSANAHEHSYPWPAAASFCSNVRVPNSPSKKKARRIRNPSNDIYETTLILSLEQKITFVSKKKSIAVGHKQVSSESLLCEIPAMEYTRQPSAPLKQKNGNERDLAPIPPVLDSFNGRIYALHEDHNRLLSWPASGASGPDDTKSTSLGKNNIANSLSVLPLPDGRSLVYVSCCDGSLYFVRCEDKSSVQVLLMPPPVFEKEGGQHVATLVQTAVSKPQHDDNDGEIGQKRKSSDSEGYSIVYFQIFSFKQELTVVRKKVELPIAQGKDLIKDSQKEQRSCIPLFSSDGGRRSSSNSIDSTRLVGYLESEATAILRFDCHEEGKRSQNGCSSVRSQFYASLSLHTGGLTKSPIEVVPETRQACLLAPSILAVWTTQKEIWLYDIKRGARIQRVSLQALGLENDQDLTLITDTRRNRLAVLFNKGGRLCVALAVAAFSKPSSPTASSGSLSLAEALAATAETPFMMTERQEIVCKKNLAAIGQPTSKVHVDNEIECDVTRRSLELLKVSYRSIVENPAGRTSLLDAYERGISMLSGTNEKPKKGKYSRAKENEQPKNGVKETNSHAITPKLVPETYVGRATLIVMEVLFLPQNATSLKIKDEARLILKGLVRTGKVSARKHLGSNNRSLRELFRVLEPDQKEKSISYSPVNLCFDLFLCEDVSERQMVASLHYLMSLAAPSDIATFFHHNNNYKPDHSIKILSRDYNGLFEKERFAENHSPDLEQLASRLILSAVSVLMEVIVGYSDCNEALLRSALMEGISECELGLLARQQANYILPGTPSKKCHKPNSLRVVQWLSALCDSLRHAPSGVQPADIDCIRKCISVQIKTAEHLIGLRNVFDENIASIEKNSNVQMVTKEDVEQSEIEIPSYSIERVVF